MARHPRKADGQTSVRAKRLQMGEPRAERACHQPILKLGGSPLAAERHAGVA